MHVASELGIGIAFGPGAATGAGTAGYDFVEYSPSAELTARGESDAAGCAVISSTSLPVGGSCDPDSAQLANFAERVALVRPAYVTAGVGFNRFSSGSESRATGLLLPAPRTTDGVAVSVRRIQHLRELLGVPVAFEIGANYLRAGANDLPDAVFFSAIAQHANCGIVLDLACIAANEANGHGYACESIDALPLERVWEVRVSGMTTFRGYAIDSRSGLVPCELRLLAERIVPRLPALRACVYAARQASLRDIDARLLRDQRDWLAHLWTTRGTNAAASTSLRQPAALVALPRYEDARVRVGAWERALVGRIAGVTSANDDDTQSYSLLAHLSATARKAAIAERAELSLRLLEATLGRAALADSLERYCAQTSAEALPSLEALRFLQFIERERTDVPYLREVIAFERAASRAAVGTAETAIHFPCEPTEIFRALLRHDRPYVIDRRPHVVHVGPRGIRIEGVYRQAGL